MMRIRSGQTLLLYCLIFLQVFQICYYFTSLQPSIVLCTSDPTPPSARFNETSLLLGKLNVLSDLKDVFMQQFRSLQLRSSGPTVYIVTPTYRRPAQIADLTRLAQTLMNVNYIFWIVVEDGETTSDMVAETLERSGVPHKYLAASTPAQAKNLLNIGRGVFNRRAALEWLREHDKRGVLYFADDDNTYDIRLFDQIRRTELVSVFPVGMILDYGISSPIVRHHKVVGFHDAFQARRTFAVDMAGFAVNLELVRSHPEATMPLQVSYLEDGFLRSLDVSLDDLEPLAHDCTQVLVWHTRTVPPSTPNVHHIPPTANDTNLPSLYAHLLA